MKTKAGSPENGDPALRPTTAFIAAAAFSAVATPFLIEMDEETVCKMGGFEEITLVSRHRFLPHKETLLAGASIGGFEDERIEGMEGIKSAFGYVNYLDPRFKGSSFLGKFYIDERDGKCTVLTIDGRGAPQFFVGNLQLQATTDKLSYY